ncbi:Exonuclease family protein, partial [Escherichia coli O111:H8 str. CVM9570]
EVNTMYPELKLHAIGWVKHKCIPGAKWPEIQAEMRIWKKRREGERKETGKYTSVVDLARARANQQYTENSTGKISPVIAAIHREYKQTWKTLDDELAYALWPGDVDAGNIDGSIHRWAKNEVIDNGREDWKRISASMRKQPDALRYDRQTIFGLVRERPIDIHKDPVALNKYITEYLTTKGVFEDEGTNQSATDTLSSPVPETDAVETAIPDNEKTECKVEVEPSVEREGPFYFLFTDKDGEKYGRANKLSGLDKALSAGATEITKEEYFARKNGTYSGSQQNTGASDTTAQPGSVKVTADEVNKIMQAANISQPDADELLAVSRGEFVEGISDPNDPKWVKGIQTRDSVNQNQQETEQNDQKAEQNSPNTQQNEPETKQPEPLQHQKKLLAVFGKVPADSIKPEHIRRYMDKRGEQSKTQANHEKSSMSRVYSWGYERGYVKGNPCAGVSKFKAKNRERYVTDKEYQAVLSVAPLPVFIAMEIAYLCAARVSDVLSLKWEQIGNDGIFIQQGKTGKKQIKAWSPRLQAAIEKAKQLPTSAYVISNQYGNRYMYKGFNEMWVEARNRAGKISGILTDFTFHDLKAKGISDYEGSSRDKQLFSGHKTEGQVLIYDRKVKVSPTLDVPLPENIPRKYSK